MNSIQKDFIFGFVSKISNPETLLSESIPVVFDSSLCRAYSIVINKEFQKNKNTYNKKEFLKYGRAALKGLKYLMYLKSKDPAQFQLKVNIQFNTSDNLTDILNWVAHNKNPQLMTLGMPRNKQAR